MYSTEASLSLIFLISFVGIGLIVLGFIFALIKHRKYVKRLRQAKIQAEISTLENERKRIAADIHDELGPLLSAAKLKYSEAEVFSTTDQKLIEQGHRIIDETVAKMRLIAADLLPTTLLYRGLVLATKEFIDQVSFDSLDIHFEPGEIPDIPPFHSLHIYRILKEIIHNTLKHAEATGLRIVMESTPTHLLIKTVDNGKGFNYNSMIRNGNGLGLYNIQSRADLLHGLVQVKSQSGRGTSFFISIPYNN